MRFTITRSAFLATLKIAAGIAPKKSPMAILSTVALRVESSTRITIAATDAQGLSVTAAVTISGGEKGGSCVVVADLLAIVSSLKGDDLTIRTIENTRIEIKAGKSKYEIVAVPDREFPKVPASPDAALWADCDATHLADALARVGPSVSIEEQRAPFNGALLERKDDAITAVGTDGKRMTVVVTDIKPATLAASVVIPVRALSEVQRILSGRASCMVAAIGDHLFVRVEEMVLAVKLITTPAYPAWNMLMPKAAAKFVEVARAELADRIKAVGLMSEVDKHVGVTLKFTKGSDAVAVEARHVDKGDASDEVTLSAPWKDADLTISLNPSFARAALEACGGERVKMMLGRELDPVSFRSSDDTTTGVVMPVRPS